MGLWKESEASFYGIQRVQEATGDEPVVNHLRLGMASETPQSGVCGRSSLTVKCEVYQQRTEDHSGAPRVLSETGNFLIGWMTRPNSLLSGCKTPFLKKEKTLCITYEDYLCIYLSIIDNPLNQTNTLPGIRSISESISNIIGIYVRVSYSCEHTCDMARITIVGSG